MQSLKFALYLATHPFAGYWDMKYEKKGKMKAVWTILALVVLTMVFEHMVGGYLYNYGRNYPVNVMAYIKKVGFLFFLAAVANWSVTTLMDGEGSLKDIMMAIGYALVPYIMIHIPMAIATNFFTFDQAAYINFIYQVSTYWMYALFFVGIMTVHQYSVGKTVFTVILTLVSMAIIVFIYTIFNTLTTQIVGFIQTIYKEIALRL